MALEMLLVIVRHLLSERNLPAARQQLEMAKKVYQLLREDTVQFRGSLFDLEQLKREIDAELKQLFKKMAGTHVWCLPRNLLGSGKTAAFLKVYFFETCAGLSRESRRIIRRDFRGISFLYQPR